MNLVCRICLVDAQRPSALQDQRSDSKSQRVDKLSFVPFLGQKEHGGRVGVARGLGGRGKGGRCRGGRMSCWDNITLRCAGWHRGPDLEWKTGPELGTNPKKPCNAHLARRPLGGAPALAWPLNSISE